jgi:Caspase domain
MPERPLHLTGTNYLFVIAIDKYPHCNSLNNCVKDAKKLVDLLTTKYQFERNPNVTLFELYDSEATGGNIMATFDKLIELVNSKKDNVVIYFAGHGIMKETTGTGFWLPYETVLSDQGSFISHSSILEHIQAIKAHHVLTIVDSCYSGAMFNREEILKGADEHISSNTLITSGRKEPVNDGIVGKHSPFADDLIYFLTNNSEPLYGTNVLSTTLINLAGNNKRKAIPRYGSIGDANKGGTFFFRLKGLYLESTKIKEEKNPIIFLPELKVTQNKIFLKKNDAKIQSFFLIVGMISLIIITIIYTMYWKKPAITNSIEKPQTEQMVETISLEEQDYSTALSQNKIPVWMNFIKNYPNSVHISDAKRNLKELNTLITKHVANAEQLIKDFPKDAKIELQTILSIDPNHLVFANFLKDKRNCIFA